MQRYQQMFQRLSDEKRGAFVPFVTVGDPQPELSFQIIKALIDGGADALELGIPFSDPIADGPTIQNANIRALAAGVTPAMCFDIIKRIRAYDANIPIGLLLYSNLVMAKGLDTFYATAAAAGVDSVLIADVPLSESKMFRQAAMAHNIAPIYIVPPNVDDDDLRAIASYGRGYTYLLSRAGVTGAETKAAMPTAALIERIRAYNPAPPLLGFGISSPEQVRAAIDNGAAGAISGSAIVNIIEQNQADPALMLSKLQKFVSEMKAAS
ncbi:tryptophan synthase subunit alpha [Alishewanella sp. SMS8]|uniref:tryptophan synthase subunit alpha n=1 Tax=Alishewanella sp. SMS8 TaxID=2994676 RepID=UPI002740C109|nr:tryptophan synthase subunit alpha [Alishewanella sp. SMS8]MDP5186060.1 tryptophan synthase subunit alpha [Alishewanella sp.]MDP5460087.1 tryptophan synthase subunit alpha [Alishewanella sp. SMS8]